MKLAPFAEAAALISAADPDATIWPFFEDGRSIIGIYFQPSAPKSLRLSSSIRRKLRSLGMVQAENHTWYFPSAVLSSSEDANA